MHMLKKLSHFFDRLEDHVRASLSRRPILYTFIGGVGVVLFWRGVWHTADFVSAAFPVHIQGQSWEGVFIGPWWDGPLSLLISVSILLVIGLFVSTFIGDSLILSGLKKDKKLVEKTESEIRSDEQTLERITEKLEKIDKEVQEIKKEL